jgi:hypothetical protein
MAFSDRDFKTLCHEHDSDHESVRSEVAEARANLKSKVRKYFTKQVSKKTTIGIRVSRRFRCLTEKGLRKKATPGQYNALPKYFFDGVPSFKHASIENHGKEEEFYCFKADDGGSGDEYTAEVYSTSYHELDETMMPPENVLYAKQGDRVLAYTSGLQTDQSGLARILAAPPLSTAEAIVDRFINLKGDSRSDKTDAGLQVEGQETECNAGESSASSRPLLISLGASDKMPPPAAMRRGFKRGQSLRDLGDGHLESATPPTRGRLASELQSPGDASDCSTRVDSEAGGTGLLSGSTGGEDVDDGVSSVADSEFDDGAAWFDDADSSHAGSL